MIPEWCVVAYDSCHDPHRALIHVLIRCGAPHREMWDEESGV